MVWWGQNEYGLLSGRAGLAGEPTALFFLSAGFGAIRPVCCSFRELLYDKGMQELNLII